MVNNPITDTHALLGFWVQQAMTAQQALNVVQSQLAAANAEIAALKKGAENAET